MQADSGDFQSGGQLAAAACILLLPLFSFVTKVGSTADITGTVTRVKYPGSPVCLAALLLAFQTGAVAVSP